MPSTRKDGGAVAAPARLENLRFKEIRVRRDKSGEFVATARVAMGKKARILRVQHKDKHVLMDRLLDAMKEVDNGAG